MKLIKTLLLAATAASVLTALPAMAGDGKSFKDKVVVEEETKWWGASLSTGWDSLYMFRGVNVLRGDMEYGSGIYWTDLNVTFFLSKNDTITIGAWTAFGTQKTDYKEVDIYASYTHTFGDLALSLGYIFYDLWATPLYENELNVKAAYTFHLPNNITIVPSLAYYFDVGPDIDDEGTNPQCSSFLTARVDAGIPIYKDIVSLAPWVQFASNFRYNSKLESDGNLHYFNGVNNIEMGIGVPVKINSVITLYGYGSYSYAFYDLAGTTDPSTFWGGAKVTFSF